MSKSVLKNSVLEIAEHIGFLNFIQKISPGNGQYVYVLAYHRVAEYGTRPWLAPNLISASPEQFEEQMNFVADKYNPVSIYDVLDAIHGNTPLPRDAVLITVDDGYKDFKEEIFPVCARYGIRPLLFVPTAFVGEGTFWWDKVYQIIQFSGKNRIETPVGNFSLLTENERSKALEQITGGLKLMPFEKAMEWVEAVHAASVQLTEDQNHNTLTWDALRQLVREGVTVACHTHTHPILTRISLEDARCEVLKSQEIICRELGDTLPVFAFPDGMPHAFSNALFEMLYSEGFEMLFLLTGGRAFIKPGNKKMSLPRLSVWQSQTLSQFHMRLTPLWNLYEAGRRKFGASFLE